MITSELLAKIFPDTKKSLRDRFLPALNKYLPLYGIDSYLRVCAFLATAGVESDYFRVTTEYASGADYEWRKDLGNNHEGDGKRFRGRGIFQTTGRFNYDRVNKTVGKKLGIDFLKNPERLAEIDIAVESACIFWKENNLAKYADARDFRSFSAVVNCGNPNSKPNHWAKRNELYQLCLRRVPRDFSWQSAVAVSSEDVGVPAADCPLPTAPAECQPPTANAAGLFEKFSFKTLLAKYGKHCQGDTVKNAASIVGTRVSAPLAGLWLWGIHGKILLILGALLLLVCGGRAIYKYRVRVKTWASEALDYFTNNG